MKKFLPGMLAGAVALAVTVPLIAQLASAAPSSSSSAAAKTRPVPTQACIQAMAVLDDAEVVSIDAAMAARKAAITAHSAALKAAAAITDDTQRQAAVKKANDDFRSAMQKAMQDEQAALKSTRDAVIATCGTATKGFGRFGFGGPGVGFGWMGSRGPGRGGLLNDTNRLQDFATKLGITVDQLTAELKSGRTLGQIAAEHGVTLPTSLTMQQNGRGLHRGWLKGPSAGQSSSSAQ